MTEISPESALTMIMVKLRSLYEDIETVLDDAEADRYSALERVHDQFGHLQGLLSNIDASGITRPGTADEIDAEGFDRPPIACTSMHDHDPIACAPGPETTVEGVWPVGTRLRVSVAPNFGGLELPWRGEYGTVVQFRPPGWVGLRFDQRDDAQEPDRERIQYVMPRFLETVPLRSADALYRYQLVYAYGGADHQWSVIDMTTGTNVHEAHGLSGPAYTTTRSDAVAFRDELNRRQASDPFELDGRAPIEPAPFAGWVDTREDGSLWLDQDSQAPCPRGCEHPIMAHRTDVGCILCDCTHGRPAQ